MDDLKGVLAIQHDAEAISVECVRNSSSAKLGLSNCSGEIWSFHFDDVVFIRAVDLVEQNVISRLLQSSVFTFSDYDIHYWLMWLTSFTDVKSAMPAERIEDYQRQIRSGELSLFVLEPSRGMEFAVVSRRISWSKLGTVGLQP